VGNVPVESSVHGSALIWRLLEPYPTEKLLIVECEHASKPEGRLAGVRYLRSDIRGRRLLFSRVAPYARPWIFRFSRLLSGPVRAPVAQFRPQAILTVAHEFYWKIAAEIAASLGVPLHLIVHDAAVQMAPEGDVLRPMLEKSFSGVYRSAASRLCVSPHMAEIFAKRYGAAGTVLYPSRATHGVVFDAPPRRLAGTQTKLTAIFAGTLYDSYAAGLVALAHELRKVGGRLVLFGPTTEKARRRFGLELDNVESRGMVHSEELKALCRNEADFLFVPMSFTAAERFNMEVCFPSKLADYTAIGCPILIRGPEYCAAVRWARENPGAAEVVDRDDPESLAAALQSLMDPGRRMELARNALRIGDVHFSAARANRIFQSALVGATAGPAR
jgi:glycosyltransferase involved in cell wall biosynthesis